MEHTLGEKNKIMIDPEVEVLILVLVEHTLGVREYKGVRLDVNCLNPCFSGTYSRSTYV